MTTLLLDTHVLLWWSMSPDELSNDAIAAMDASDEFAVAPITWFELSWLAERGRIRLPLPLRSWLDQVASAVRTLSITPAIAVTAASLPASFPRDPADRLIYATAIEEGLQLVTRDQRLRNHPFRTQLTIW